MLRQLGYDKELPWLISGDFNEILYTYEKVGGALKEEGRKERFRKVLEDCSLHDIGFSRNWFTWEREGCLRVRILKNSWIGGGSSKWLERFPLANIQHLPHSLRIIVRCLFILSE